MKRKKGQQGIDRDVTSSSSLREELPKTSWERRIGGWKGKEQSVDDTGQPDSRSLNTLPQPQVFGVSATRNTL
jgi:hypothetical protein